MRAACAAILLMTSAGCTAPSPELLDCLFIPVELPEDQLPDCAYIQPDGRLVLLPAGIAAVRARHSDPVAAVVGSTPYYLNSVLYVGRSKDVGGR
jgi:hypothetical protein